MVRRGCDISSPSEWGYRPEDSRCSATQARTSSKGELEMFAESVRRRSLAVGAPVADRRDRLAQIAVSSWMSIIRSRPQASRLSVGRSLLLFVQGRCAAHIRTTGEDYNQPFTAEEQVLETGFRELSLMGS